MIIRRPLVCFTIFYLTVIVILYLAFGIDFNRDSVLISTSGSFVTISGEVTSVTETGDDSCRLIVSVTELGSSPSGKINDSFASSLNKNPKGELILINVYGEPQLSAGIKGYHDLTGRRIRAGISVETPSGKRNPGTFDYNLYLKTKKIYVTGTCSSTQLMASNVISNHFRNYLAGLRHDFLEHVENSSLQKNVVKSINNNENSSDSNNNYYSDDTIVSENSNTLNNSGFPDNSGNPGSLKNSGNSKTISTGAVISAIFFGDKSRIDDETYNAFQKNGTAHVLAVSGLHIGIIYSFINMLWKWRRRFLYSIVMILFLFSYAALADFSPSVMRAFIMIALHIISKLIHKRYDMLTAAACSALAITIYNPMQVFNSGFILSFGAIAVLSVLLPVLPKGKKGALLLPLILQAVMLPYTAYNFNYISVIGFILNFPVIFIANMLLPIGVILMFFIALYFGGPFSVLCTPVSELGFSLLRTITGILIKINESTCIQGLTTFNVASPPIWFVIVFYGLFFLFMSEFFRIFFLRKEKSHMKQCISVILVFSIICWIATDRSFMKCDFVFVDVGQGDCVHLRCGSRNYLFDSGGKKDFDLGRKTLEPYLLKSGVNKLTGAFITHTHTDHFDGLKQLSRDYKIENVFFSKNYYPVRQSLEKSVKAVQYSYLNNSNTVSLGKDCNLKVLWPIEKTNGTNEAGFIKQNNSTNHTMTNSVSTTYNENSAIDMEDENTNSMIMKLSCHGVSMLITGDIDSECEKQIVNYYKGTNMLKSDILKVAHHGSHYSSCDEFLDAVDPDIAVIQVGKNNYGHPSQETLMRLESRNIKIYRNDECGAIGIEIKNGKIAKVMQMADKTGRR